LGGGELEYYQDVVAASGNSAANGTKLLVIKFPGTGGRAERSSNKPADRWPHDSILWTVNPMGYGRSTGPATLERYPEMIMALGEHAMRSHPNRKMVVCGNSLGGMSALAMAANFSVAGILLRNPAPVHQLIGQRPRYLWPSLGLSKVLAAQIPRYLDAVCNAQKCTCPCWIVVSQRDTVVPVSFQRQIIDRYGGLIDVFPLPEAGHATPVPPALEDEYLQWVDSAGDVIARES